MVDEEGHVGRIVLTVASFAAGRDRPRFWSIACKCPRTHHNGGNAANLEEDMPAFKTRWEVVSADGRPQLP